MSEKFSTQGKKPKIITDVGICVQYVSILGCFTVLNLNVMQINAVLSEKRKKIR